MKVICEKCGKEITCNGTLGLRMNCGVNNAVMKLKVRTRNGNLTDLPFRDTQTNQVFCVCFECWKKHKGLTDEAMFKVACWEGLKKGFEKGFGNPSHRRGRI